LRLRVGNLLDRPVRIDLALDVAPPLRLAGLAPELTVPAAAASEVVGTVTGVAELVLPATVTVRASWRGGQSEHRVEFRPLLVNGNLDVDADGDGIPDGWDVGGTTRQFPYGLEDGAFWIQGRKEEYVFLLQGVDLKPNTAYILAGRLRKSVQAPSIRIALAEQTAENQWRVQSIGDQVKAAGEWEEFERTLTTGESFRRCQIYLYTVHTEAKAWFDDIRLAEAAPKEPQR
jgi:hypothetical protein